LNLHYKGFGAGWIAGLPVRQQEIPRQLKGLNLSAASRQQVIIFTQKRGVWTRDSRQVSHQEPSFLAKLSEAEFMQ
jgi:hypothetical protein